MPQRSNKPTPKRAALSLRAEHLPALALGGAAVVATLLFTPAVWLVVLTDGMFVSAVLLAGAGWGAWPVAALGLGRRPLGQQLCTATALGLGILSTLTLALGTAGWLSRVVAWGLLGGGGVLGLIRVCAAQSGTGRASAASEAPAATDPARTLGARAERPRAGPARRAGRSAALQALALLPLCVPLAIALFGATLPPGLLWTPEARGYDVLEYHLQVPREHFQAGQIRFLPHNVYASFPQQTETLYLLLMHLVGDPLHAAIPAQLLHASFGVLTVLALLAWATPGWPRILVALLAGSVPWLAQLACLAYVELAMLFFAAVAAGLVVDHYRPAAPCDWRTALAAGLCAGLAGGCKYTALVLVAGALGTAWLFATRGGLRTRVLRLALFALGTLAAFGPWLIRNAAFTGNPVYPFAYAWFGGQAWSAQQDAQWARGHRLPDDEDSLAGRVRILADELLASGMYGAAVWILPAVVLVLWPARRNWLAATWLLLIIFVWATWTHMPGRFAVPVIVPLALLLSAAAGFSGQSSGSTRLANLRKFAPAPLLIAAALGALANGATLLRMLRGERESWERRAGIPLAGLVGRPDVLRAANLINQVVTDPTARVWMVGDAAAFYVTPRSHYTVAFSRDPWLEFAADGATPEQCVAWLRSRSVTHVLFSWPEIERLRRSYGFSPVVTPEWVAQLVVSRLRRVLPREVGPIGEGPEVYEVLPR